MFKTMSFNKILGLFVGFLVLMILVTVAFVKITSKGTNVSSKPVVTKTHKQREEPVEVAAPAASGPVALQPGIAGVNDQEGRLQPQFQPQLQAQTQGGASSAGQGSAASQSVTPPAPLAVNPMAGPSLPQQVGAQQAVVVAPALVDMVLQRLNNIDTSLLGLDARMTAMEAKRLSTVESTRKASVHSTGRITRKMPEQIDQEVARYGGDQRPIEEKEKPLSEMPGYKSMAIVGNRAWVATADEVEDSVAKGEALPRARVRSMNAETGIVVTTTDQRIDPR